MREKSPIDGVTAVCINLGSVDMNRSKRRYGAILTVVIVLAAFVAFNLICVGTGAYAELNKGAVSLSGNRFLRVDGLDGLDELRQKYFNTAAFVDLAKVSYEGDRWVIVELEGETLYDAFKKSAYSDFSAYCKTDAADKLRNKLEADHAEFLDLLDENAVEYTYKYSYTTLNNGVAIKINSGAYNVIKQTNGVKDLYFSETYAEPKVAVSNNAQVYTTGIYDSAALKNYNGNSYQGEGMVVAVLDTGLDASHEAFQNMPSNPAWTKEDVASKMANSNNFSAKATVDEVYYNAKVPFAYDYADDDPEVYPSYSTHGTHVAGIVAGKSDYVVNDETGETFLGVAPEAQLVICKVFTDNLDSKSLGGANSIDILAAVSDCVELGVDVINMSLGTSCGFSDERSDTKTTEIYNRVKEAGISLIVAASNDYSSGFGGGNGTNLASNPDSATVGSPSTYPAALSVASINGQEATYIQANDDANQFAFITTSSDENGNEYKFVELLYDIAKKPLTETLNFKYVVIGGVGRATNYNTVVRREIADKAGYDGVIALVKRGDTTFAEKVQTAMDYDVDACIIYNNVSGVIRMSLGEVDNPVPTCSISMDAGKVLVDNAVRNVGSIQVSMDFKAGPFMSDFSSWGPLPNLELKPEITAHGGEITSAVPGGYDIYSGTSMASPNMAGAVAILRQYLKETYPELASDPVALNARINQVMMSTTTIALNEEGNPYSPRKQGAGLARIFDAVKAESYITVLDEKGNAKDKTKAELFDDKKRTGVYTVEFVINNTSGKTEWYNPYTYVMTETLASDNKTVAEKAHMLTDSTIVYYVNGVEHSGDIEVSPNATLSVKAVITLGAAGRSYIEKSFVNGMFVEGFVSLRGTKGTEVTIGLPYLAFYGDWNDAPLFDYDTYEIAESEKDTSIAEENKLKASAAATRPLGIYWDDKYILELGAYLYSMDESEVAIYPSREKAAVSMYDEVGRRTIYEFYMVYAGLLRNAAYMNVEVTDSVTGELIYKERQENIGKSYAAGGSNVGARIALELNPSEWGLSNNSTYNVHLQGELDYANNGERNSKDSFDCQFTVDYEAPRMMEYRVRYDSYKDENKQTKYRIFLDVDVYDNQYVMEVMPCYLRPDKDGEGNILTLATEYPIPVHASGRGELNTVSFEITDIYDDFVKAGELYLAIEDYAMNQSVYKVILDSAIEYPTGAILYTDSKLTDSGNTGRNSDGTEYGIYDLVLAPHEAYKPTVSITPNDVLPRALSLSIASGNAVVVNEEEIFAKSTGLSTVVLCGDGQEEQVIYAKINIIVTGEEKQLPRLNKISFLPAIGGSYNAVILEGTLPTLEINTNQSVELRIKTEPWYLADYVEYEWSTSNDAIASVDENGNVQALQKGSTVVTASVVGNATVSKSVSIVVSDEFRVISYTLYDYFGGEDCVIPDRKNIMYIDEECFQYNTTLRRIVLPSTLTELPEYAFKGCVNLEEVVIPGQCTTIKKGAFEGCTKLTKVSFGYFVDKNKKEDTNFYGAINVGAAAFKNCTALTTLESVSLSDPSVRAELTKRITTVGNSAFEGCVSLKAVDLTELRVTGSRVFAKCTSLDTVIIGNDTQFGAEMFYGCAKLKSLDGEFMANNVPAGIFAQCSSFDTFAFANANAEKYTVGNYAFSETALAGITFPDGEVTIGSGAFFGCNSLKYAELSDNTVLKANELSPFGSCALFGEYRVSASNANYSVETGVLYNKDKTEICAVPTAITELTLPVSVKAIGRGAFAGTKFLDNLDASNIEKVDAYAFAGSSVKTVAFSSELTILGNGIFSGCTALTAVTGLDSVIEVGDNAFNDCTSLKEISLPKVEKIGNNAFDGSALATVSAENLIELGYRAFYKTKLKEVNFPNLAKIGEEAFANNNILTTVTLGPVTEMGGSVFVNTMRLNSVVFGEGTKVVGDRAFYTEYKDGTNKKLLTSVTLPDGVEKIGSEAFRSCVNLRTVNLTGTEIIGDNAFYGCAKLQSANLTSVLSVGNGAFEGAGLQEAVLTVATVVGVNAFKDSKLETLSIPNVERIGAYAFAGTLLTEVTIPATMNERGHVYNWDKLDDKNRVEKVYSRIELNYGNGAFADIATLTQINVATGNAVYFSVDGVLYSYVENGYVLEQYPSAKQGTSYTVIDGTIAIGASAFEGVNVLTKVTFPYSVKTIGSRAFFGCSVKNFVFNSVEAPELLADPVDGDVYYNNNMTEEEEMLFVIFGSNPDYCVNSDVYYANFCNYVAHRIFLLEEYQPKFDLSMTIPKNGKGYDSEIWTKFFDEIIVTDDILPDNTTHEALDAINKIEKTMSLAEIATAVDMDALAEISKVVSEARVAYNKITSSEQLNLTETKEALATLLANEKALRDRKAALGHPVKVSGLELAAIPTKIRYNDGETFDPTGMEVKVIFEDGSELPITEYVLDKTVLRYGDEFVTISYTDGQTYTVKVLVNVSAPETKDPGKDPNEGGDDPIDEDKNGLSVGAIVGISVGSVAFVAIVVVVVLLLLRKKGILGGKKKEEAVEEIVATENETTEE